MIFNIDILLFLLSRLYDNCNCRRELGLLHRQNGQWFLAPCSLKPICFSLYINCAGKKNVTVIFVLINIVSSVDLHYQ